jgi:hypothetical protein
MRAKLSRTNKITTAVLVVGLLIITLVHTSLQKRATKRTTSTRPSYRFEDEDYRYEDTPYRALRNREAIANHFKQLLRKEIDDGTLPVPDLSNDERDEAKFQFGELPCPDGDDEHVYRLRRMYPCRTAR